MAIDLVLVGTSIKAIDDILSIMRCGNWSTRCSNAAIWFLKGKNKNFSSETMLHQIGITNVVVFQYQNVCPKDFKGKTILFHKNQHSVGKNS